MTRYSKFIAAVLGAAAAVVGIEMDEDAIAQGATLISAALVYWLPNRA